MDVEEAETSGEVVFNTSMTGYQEVLTDPSYAGQIVTMTYPLIGNYGVHPQDEESDRIHVKGFIVKEFCRHPSHAQSKETLTAYLERHQILAMEGVDTRALTRRIRVYGSMKGIISTDDFDPQSLARKLDQVPSMEGADWVRTVTAAKRYVWPAKDERRYVVAAIDCGIKRTILRILGELGCEVHVFPATVTPEEILSAQPDGLFVSNGPGDPAAVEYVQATLRALVGKLPIFGICLGHQLLGLALGGKTYKLKFGHHGANHPVKDCLNGRISITAQNHGFCVDPQSFPSDDVEVVQVNLNDRTAEGLRHKRWPIVSFQHHPEAAPGPSDARYLFNNFIDLMDACRNAQT